MRITDRKIAFDGHYKLSQLTVQDGEKHYQRERFEPGRAVAALVFDTAKQVYLFTRQFRVGSESDLLEVAAGMLDQDGEDPPAAMTREIEEELGYEVDRLESIVDLYPSPGASAERILLYYAEVSCQTGPGGGLAEEGETIEPVALTLAQLNQEKFEDAKTLIAVQWAQLRALRHAQ